MRARGFDVKNDTMIYFDDVVPVKYKNQKKHQTFYSKKPSKKYTEEIVDLGFDTLMYSAGYSDDNDKEIYENDIIIVTLKNEDKVLTILKFFGGAFRFCLINKEDGKPLPQWKLESFIKKIKVIGNTFEDDTIELIQRLEDVKDFTEVVNGVKDK